MKLTKYQIRAIVGYATLLLVFSVLAFLLPFKHTAIFWIGYGFGMVCRFHRECDAQGYREAGLYPPCGDQAFL